MKHAARRICAVTGSRAEYGYLLPLLRALYADCRFELQLVVTGQHLSSEFGYTVEAIEADGLNIADRVDSLVSGDSPAAAAKSLGLGVIGFADVLQRLRPDWLLVLGDRYEVFAAVQAALLASVPVAHIAGGDTSEGAFDESIRHSISKMAHVHFATNELSGRRLRQLGEDPHSIHVVGSPSLDLVRTINLMDRAALAAALGVKFRRLNLLVTYHPVTLDATASTAEFDSLLAALDALGDDVGLFFTRPNADPGARLVMERLDAWVASRPHARVFTSLGQQRYWSLLKEVDAVVGNSSSGLYEAPSLGTPTVDIGDRQRGRVAARSVVHCDGDVLAIARAIELALKMDAAGVANPYGHGHAAERIVEILAAIENPRALLKKQFHLAAEQQ